MRVAFALLAFCFAACSLNGPHRSEDSPVRVGRKVYAGTLDDRLEILFFEASDTALTVAYDKSLCGLAAAWKGPVVGPARTAWGSNTSQGPVYHRQTAARLWTVRNGEDTLLTPVRFLGYEEDSTGYVAFRYALILPSGDSIKVVETPSLDDHYGDNALRRDFRLTGIPYGATVSVLLGGTAGQWPELWEQSGGGLLLGPAGAERLEMTFDDLAVTKVRWQGSAAR